MLYMKANVIAPVGKVAVAQMHSQPYLLGEPFPCHTFGVRQCGPAIRLQQRTAEQSLCATIDDVDQVPLPVVCMA